MGTGMEINIKKKTNMLMYVNGGGGNRCMMMI